MRERAILVVNAGSSSVKFALYRDNARTLQGEIDGIGEAPRLSVTASGQSRGESHDGRHDERLPAGLDHEQAVARVLALARQHAGDALAAAGHRVVHGGLRYAAPTRVSDEVMRDLDALVPLAPLHQAHGLAAIRVIARALPDLPQVACFDTQFHRTQPDVAQALALPPEVTGEGMRRYGFHGLSYEYVAGALREVDAAAAQGRVVVAHLGSGASMCALRDGASVATTMGFTTLDGLMMGTRAGSLDPGVLLYLQAERGYDVDALTRLLYREAGLLGVSGLSADMRVLLASAAPRAAQAVALFCYHSTRELGSLAAALGGLDAVVFTGGIGEHSVPVRARIVEASAWLGLSLDPAANARNATRITTVASRIPAYVIPTDEARVIARQTRAVLGWNGRPDGAGAKVQSRAE
jgi:acetate kinase